MALWLVTCSQLPWLKLLAVGAHLHLSRDILRPIPATPKCLKHRILRSHNAPLALVRIWMALAPRISASSISATWCLCRPLRCLVHPFLAEPQVMSPAIPVAVVVAATPVPALARRILETAPKKACAHN